MSTEHGPGLQTFPPAIEQPAPPSGGDPDARKRELWRLFRSGTPEERKQAARELQRLQAAARRLRKAERRARERELATARKEAERAKRALATRERNQALLPRRPTELARVAITAADMPPALRRELFDAAVHELRAQLRATQQRPVVERGQVVGYVEVPDNAARLKAISEVFTLLGSKASSPRQQASAPVLNIAVADFAKPAAPPVPPAPTVIDVTPRDTTPFGE